MINRVKRYGVPPWMTLAGCHYHSYNCGLKYENCIPVWRMKKNGGQGPLIWFLRRYYSENQ